jgi:hypothetical protein
LQAPDNAYGRLCDEDTLISQPIPHAGAGNTNTATSREKALFTYKTLPGSIKASHQNIWQNGSRGNRKKDTFFLIQKTAN